MKTALVTGGSGFLGGHVVPRLTKNGYEVVALARSAEAAGRVEHLGATPIFGDLDDPASIDRAFGASAADVLVNLASLGFGQAPTVVAAAAEAGITRGVFVSSTAIFTTIDAPSKPRRLAGEHAVTESPLDWTVIRPTMIYGAPGDRNLARLLRLLQRTPVLPLPGGGDRLQQPVHVDDLADAIVHALDRPETIRRCYDVAGPAAMTFRTLLEQAGVAVGRRPRFVSVPLEPAIALARVYERVAARPRLKAEQLERLAEDKAFDIGDARRDLSFDPRPFGVGIAEEAAALAAEPHAANQEHFQEVAAGWVHRYAERPSFRRRLAVVGPIVLDAIGASGTERVLDFGGGPGVFSAIASIRAEEVVLADISQPMVRAGADLADEVAQLVRPFGRARMERIHRVVGGLDAVASAEFEVALAIAVLEYLDDPEGAIASLGVRLRSGGRLVFTVPNERSWFRRVEDVVGSLGSTVGGLVGSERLRSRAYAATRPHGNRIDWLVASQGSGLVIDRVEPLSLADEGWRSRVTATSIVVLRKL